MRNSGMLMIAILSILFSCNIGSNDSSISEYYPLDSLVEAQISYLVTNNAKLIKGNSDSTFTDDAALLDSMSWSSEFEIFHNLNINKPTFVDAYDKRIVEDDKSNLNILKYTALNEKLAIEEINIYYLNTLKDVKKIRAKINNKNTLYNSSKSLQMEFKNRDNLSILESYSIVGNQKIRMRDSLTVSIFGKILF